MDEQMYETGLQPVTCPTHYSHSTLHLHTLYISPNRCWWQDI